MTEEQPLDEDEERKEAFQKLQASVNDMTNLEASPELNNDDIFLEMAQNDDDVDEEGTANDTTTKPIKQEDDLQESD